MVVKEAVIVVVIVLSVVLWMMGVIDRPDTLVATPTLTVVAAASLFAPLRLRSMAGRRLRLVDVGDAWRALLLGAPPVLLSPGAHFVPAVAPG